MSSRAERQRRCSPRADRPTFGIVLMCIAIFLWVVHDAISKWLTEGHTLYQIIFMRSLFALLPLTLLVNREGGLRRLRTSNAP